MPNLKIRPMHSTLKVFSQQQLNTTLDRLKDLRTLVLKGDRYSKRRFKWNPRWWFFKIPQHRICTFFTVKEWDKTIVEAMLFNLYGNGSVKSCFWPVRHDTGENGDADGWNVYWSLEGKQGPYRRALLDELIRYIDNHLEKRNN